VARDQVAARQSAFAPSSISPTFGWPRNRAASVAYLSDDIFPNIAIVREIELAAVEHQQATAARSPREQRFNVSRYAAKIRDRNQRFALPSAFLDARQLDLGVALQVDQQVWRRDIARRHGVDSSECFSLRSGQIEIAVRKILQQSEVAND
jgi:hypothetical protein